MKLNWNFLGGVGVQNKKPSMGGGVWIFPGTTHSQTVSQLIYRHDVPQRKKLLPAIETKHFPPKYSFFFCSGSKRYQLSPLRKKPTQIATVEPYHVRILVWICETYICQLDVQELQKNKKRIKNRKKGNNRLEMKTKSNYY